MERLGLTFIPLYILGNAYTLATARSIVMSAVINRIALYGCANALNDLSVRYAQHIRSLI
jgi:hypothetical protein